MVVEKEGSENVVEACRERFKNALNSGLHLYLAISGGKDSIVMSDVLYKLLKEGYGDVSKITVVFIDEEAMHEECIDIVKQWRLKFMELGCGFDWYCIEVKHFNCFNFLSNDETFICWDRYEEHRWCRKPPSFAIRSHPLLKERKHSYQEFLDIILRGGTRAIGIRVAESIQRRRNIATVLSGNSFCHGKFFPIYDWADTDVWRYILENGLDFPKVYLNLWQIGTKKQNLRISQFFSIDTARVLVRLSEYDPGLMERVISREPNAYIASLYWDTDMFRGGSKKKDEETGEDIDYKEKVFEYFRKAEYVSKSQEAVANRYKVGIVLKFGASLTPGLWHEVYKALVGGDPKMRTFRALLVKIAIHIAEISKEGGK